MKERFIIIALVVSGTLAFGDAREAALLRSAIAQVKAGRAASATSSLKMLSRNTDAALARAASFWLARSALEQKTLVRATEAEKTLRTLASGTVKDQWQERAAILLAQRSWQAGKQEKALQALDRMLAANRNSPWMVMAAELSGDIHAAVPDKQKAITSYRYALKVAGYLKGYEAQEMPAELDLKRIRKKLAALNKNDRPAKPEVVEPDATFARAEAERKRNKFESAIAMYKKIVLEYPDHDLAAASGYQIGNCMLAQDDTESAKKQWESFVDADPKGAWRGQAILGIGDITLKRELDAGKAQQYFNNVVDGRSNGATWIEILPDALERYGICLLMQRDFENAEKCFAEELRLRPNRTFQGEEVPSQMEYLKRLCEEKQFPIKYPEKIMTGSRRAQTALFFAAAYGECGSYDKAIELLDLVINGKIIDATTIHKAYATYDKADDLKLLDRTDEAETLFRKCAKDYSSTPIAPLALIELANLLFAANRNSEADSTLRNIWTRFPASPESVRARYHYGWSMYFDEKWQASLDAFNELSAKYSKTWEAGKARDVIIPDLIGRIGKETR